jgi:hypothetical protein
MSAAQLLRLWPSQIGAALKRFILQRRLNQEYRNADYFKHQVANGLQGQKDSHKRIAFMESELRRLK